MRFFLLRLAGLAVCLGIVAGNGFAAGEGAQAVEKPLKQSIETRQMSQKDLDQWEKERIKLQAEYDRLSSENEVLQSHISDLTSQKENQEKLNNSLEVRDRESRRLAREIDPFIRNVLKRLEEQVVSDVPFLSEERSQRINRLKSVLNDGELAVSEKFRKVMEAVFIEAEYGVTIEVYQEKIKLAGEDIVGDIFRLGRISLFFLSLDHGKVAVYNVGQQQWVPLDPDDAPAIFAAMEMGSKHRPVELVCLPLGILAVEH